MVRLTFHDCVGKFLMTSLHFYIFLFFLGGCDGCLNVNNPDNAGLETVVADLEAIYQAEGLNETISRYIRITKVLKQLI